MIKRLGHLALTVENMDNSLAFYCGQLGLQKAFELHDDHDDPWIVYLKICEGQFIELFYGGKNKAEKVEAAIGFNHLCLEVEDIHQTVDELKAKGVVIDVEPVRGKDNNFQSWTKDPDGNLIELMQLDPTSPHMNC